MSSFLVQYHDPALETPATTPALIMNEEVVRLSKMLAVAMYAGGIPRRLGSDATDQELAIDKKRAKRIVHVAAQLLESWLGAKKHPPLPDCSKEAAIVNWPHWWEQHRLWLENRRCYVATWCIKTGSDERWAKSTLVKLNNEMQWLEYAMRD